MKRPAASNAQQPKSKRARRILLKREPKEIEDSKKALLLFGGKTSQVVKDVIADLQKLKAPGEGIRYTRKNADVRPFEIGGETPLEHFAHKTDCGMFVLGSSSKKRPHNLVVGRFFDHRLYDMVELGVDGFQSIRGFAQAARLVQLGNKPCMVFAGEAFESDPQMKLAKSLLLDLLRGQEVPSINLQGLDHVILVAALDRRLLLRQYSVTFKRSGTTVPRVQLAEAGPSLDLSLRRSREAPAELASQALQRPKVAKKKEKNVAFDALDGKVGRIYMPRQELGTIALSKGKGAKRKETG